MRYLWSTLAVFGMLQLTACCCGGSTFSSGSSDWSSTEWTSDTCFQNVPSDKQNVGDTFSVTCPADCTWGTAWGSNPYTGDSNICTAAIHAGIHTTAGGSVNVKILPGKESYTGSESNGITTSNWASYTYSFTFE